MLATIWWIGCLALLFDYPKAPFLGRVVGSGLLIKDAVKPGRYLRKIRCHQKPDSYLAMRRAFGHWRADSRWTAHLAVLKREGIVKLEGMMAAPVQAFLRDCDPETLKPGERDGYRSTPLADSDAAYAMALDRALVGVIGAYYAAQPFLRHPPGLHVTAPSAAVDEANRDGFDTRYRYDTVNQLTAHALLSTTDGCCRALCEEPLNNRPVAAGGPGAQEPRPGDTTRRRRA